MSDCGSACTYQATVNQLLQMNGAIAGNAYSACSEAYIGISSPDESEFRTCCAELTLTTKAYPVLVNVRPYSQGE